MIKPELVWDEDDVTEYNGERYKRIAHEDARAVQYDVPLYFVFRTAVWASTVSPEERRLKVASIPWWESTYWSDHGNREFCVRVDAHKPEYECEQPT